MPSTDFQRDHREKDLRHLAQQVYAARVKVQKIDTQLREWQQQLEKLVQEKLGAEADLRQWAVQELQAIRRGWEEDPDYMRLRLVED